MNIRREMSIEFAQVYIVVVAYLKRSWDLFFLNFIHRVWKWLSQTCDPVHAVPATVK